MRNLTLSFQLWSSPFVTDYVNNHTSVHVTDHVTEHVTDHVAAGKVQSALLISVHTTSGKNNFPHSQSVKRN